MPDTAELRSLEAVLRSLAVAARSLRLYPATSPIPMQSVEAVRAALDEYFQSGSDPLSLALARDGFSVDGSPVGTHIPGVRDLSGELRSHDVARIDVSSEVTGEELLAFITVVARPADEVRAEGGVAALAVADGVEHIAVSEVRLAVVDQATEDDGTGAGAGPLGLPEDAEGASAWYAAAAAAGPESFEADLAGLVKDADTEGMGQVVRALGVAFKSQPPAGQDALLALAMKPGPVRGLVGQLFQDFDAAEIAGSILSGSFGKNMLALSNALSRLPLDSVAADVRAELEHMLPQAGHTAHERDFLDHMLKVRSKEEPEQPLVTSDQTYSAVLTAATLSDGAVARARDAVSASSKDMNAAGLRAMLVLLDQQTDFERYCRSAENLAGTVPGLIEQGNLALAARVLTELRDRQSHGAGPWPDLSTRLEVALGIAAGPRAMGALVKSVAANAVLVEPAREIVRLAGDSGGQPLVTEAVTHKEPGIAVAEMLLGRRVIDLLNALAPETPWHLIGPVVSRLAAEGDPRSIATIEALMQRPDEQSRREVVTALVALQGPLANRLLANALRDPRPETVSVAARAIALSGQPGSAALLAERLRELDIDRADFPLAKELIVALARTPEPAADDVLRELASRRSFIKRGHFADIRSLVAEAIKARRAGFQQ